MIAASSPHAVLLRRGRRIIVLSLIILVSFLVFFSFLLSFRIAVTLLIIFLILISAHKTFIEFNHTLKQCIPHLRHQESPSSDSKTGLLKIEPAIRVCPYFKRKKRKIVKYVQLIWASF